MIRTACYKNHLSDGLAVRPTLNLKQVEMIAAEIPGATHVQGMLLLLAVCAAFSCAVQFSISSELGHWTKAASGRGGRAWARPVSSLSSFAPSGSHIVTAAAPAVRRVTGQQQQQQPHHSRRGKQQEDASEFSTAAHLVVRLFNLDNAAVSAEGESATHQDKVRDEGESEEGGGAALAGPVHHAVRGGDRVWWVQAAQDNRITTTIDGDAAEWRHTERN